ncbi:MAG: PIN domain-containing protein [Bythopirellula sp.]|nr:PIN domain-containing protein [Bythopirellula sp.]
MNKSLLDTDTLSWVNKAKDPIIITTATRYLSYYGNFTFSSVTVMEVVRGYNLAGNTNKLAGFLDSLSTHEILDFETSTAVLAGEIDAALLKTGQPIGRADPMIAATAIECSLILVTGNTKHFERIQALGYLLQIEDWRAATP